MALSFNACVCFGKGCIQGSPAAMRTGPEASKTESALYVQGEPPCTQSLSFVFDEICC